MLAFRPDAVGINVPPGRFDVLREIERLDPERDHQRIVHLSFGYDVSWDSIRALEIALYRTYCAPMWSLRSSGTASTPCSTT